MSTINVASESGFSGSALAERALRIFPDMEYFRAYQRSRAMSLRYAVFASVVLITCLVLLRQLPMLSDRAEMFLWLLLLISGGVLTVALLTLAGAWTQDLAIEHLANRRHRLELMEESMWHEQQQLRLQHRLQMIRQLGEGLSSERRGQVYEVVIESLIDAEEDAAGQLSGTWNTHAQQLHHLGLTEEALAMIRLGQIKQTKNEKDSAHKWLSNHGVVA